VVEVALAQTCGAAGIAADLRQQPPEALVRQDRLRDLAAAERRPQLAVDVLVALDGCRRAAQPEAAQRPPQGLALGPVEVEKGVVEVEENGADAVQATWRGR
jgi:hypothetical protein